ncbi:MAG: DUF1592 domain-containing protein [Candidatus Hydrogenedentes bacterium]|nr:DUF1592 domain-containing protein [Candidatus Hydrogenedentota bacterium]
MNPKSAGTARQPTRYSPGRLVFGLLLAAGCQSIPTESHAPAAIDVSTHVASTVQVMEKHCFSCHGLERQKADLDFQTLLQSGTGIADSDLLDRAIKAVTAREMPPENKPQPDAAELDTLLASLNAQRNAHRAAILPHPGRVTMRRLNRVEYNNTVRDLLGVTTRPSDDFPPDDSGYGFDTIGDVLTLSPLLAEKYLRAAEQIARDAVAAEIAAIGTLPMEDRRIFVCGHAPNAHRNRCATTILRHLAARAYRRPVRTEEVKRLESFHALARENGESFEQGIELALQALLVSPHFLFRVEGAQSRCGNANRAINDYEYASRISYFLWSSIPDDELRAHARKGDLQQPGVLREQITRMLRDPRARALAENFGGQWLEVRNLQVIDPDPEKFPKFTKDLRLAMAEETTLFFESIVTEDRSVLDFIGAGYTFLNEVLAEHYGMTGISGTEFQRVTVDPAQRGGILGHASVLTVTSYPARTSPVLRGRWVLDKILAAPPPPPPANVPALEATKIDDTATLRERLEMHRKDPACASCHARIDPIGFGLENYDAVGAWRTADNGSPVDSSGVLPDGRAFSGPAGLKAVLLERKNEFARCLAEKMLTYGLGRGLEDFDAPALDTIVAQMAQQDYRFSALIYEIVQSLPFKNRSREADTT